jgi:hypothetical protein
MAERIAPPEPVAHLTEHDDGQRVWLDRQEARTYCAEGEEPHALYTVDQLRATWSAAMERAAQIARLYDAANHGNTGEHIAAAIRSEAEREGEK